MSKYNSIRIILRILYRKRFYVKVQFVKIKKRVKILFFVNKKMMNIICKNFEILIMNCTYKINRYEMFLLNIVDIIFINIIFYIDFAFIYEKKKKIYFWMIQQLKKLYRTFDFRNLVVIIIDCDETLINVLKVEYFEITTLLCLFHVNKNVWTHCNFEFDENEKNFNIFYANYERVMYAHIMFEFKEIWSNLKIEYYCNFSNFYEICYHYIRNIWFMFFRKKICKICINKILHFDTIITSRLKIIHRVLKFVLRFSIDNLMIVINDIEIMIMNQLKIYRIVINEKKMKRNNAFKTTIF